MLPATYLSLIILVFVGLVRAADLYKALECQCTRLGHLCFTLHLLTFLTSVQICLRTRYQEGIQAAQ